MDDQPHKSAGFNTGVPSPAGAGLALLPLTIWLETKADLAMDWRLVGPWLLLCAVLMVSNVATYSWTSLKIRPAWRFFALAVVGLIGAMLIAEPWIALIIISVIYVGLIPFSIFSYAKVKRARQAATQAA